MEKLPLWNDCSVSICLYFCQYCKALMYRITRDRNSSDISEIRYRWSYLNDVSPYSPKNVSDKSKALCIRIRYIWVVLYWIMNFSVCFRPEMVVGWYHSHPGFGCWLSGVDINTQQSFEALSERAVAVVVDPIQSVKGKVRWTRATFLIYISSTIFQKNYGNFENNSVFCLSWIPILIRKTRRL